MSSADLKNWNIICDDSLKWLRCQGDRSIANVLTGLPDMNEVHMELPEYLEFFRTIAELIFQKLSDNGYAIFIQTDRKFDGQTIDKSYHLTDVAYKNTMKLVWHKIVLQRDVGKIDLHRPTYSHVLCYTRNGKPGAAFQDVFPVSDKLYENATPQNACYRSAEYLYTVSKSRGAGIKDGDDHNVSGDVVDPFVGRGTAGVACLRAGLTFVGIDIDEEQCQKSRDLLSYHKVGFLEVNANIPEKIPKKIKKRTTKSESVPLPLPLLLPIPLSTNVSVNPVLMKMKMKLKMNVNSEAEAEAELI